MSSTGKEYNAFHQLKLLFQLDAVFSSLSWMKPIFQGLHHLQANSTANAPRETAGMNSFGSRNSIFKDGIGQITNPFPTNDG